MAFFIPALVGGAKALAATGIKKAAIGAVKKKAVGAAKNFVTRRGKKKGKEGVASKGGALVRSVGGGLSKSGAVGSSFIPKGGALVKSPSGSISTTSGDGGTSFESMSTTLDNIVGLTSQIETIAQSQYTNRKAANQEARKEKDKEKRERREEQLEKNKNIPGSALLGKVAKKANQFGLGKFLMNILMGGVALALFDNFDKIMNMFDTISTALTGGGNGKSNKGLLNLLRIGILTLSNMFKGTAKKVDNLAGKVLKGLGKKLNKIGKGFSSTIKTGFKKLSNGLKNYGRNALKGLRNLASGLPLPPGLRGFRPNPSGSALRSGGRGFQEGLRGIGSALRGGGRGLQPSTRSTGVAKRAFRRGDAANNIVSFKRPSSSVRTPIKAKNLTNLKNTPFSQSGLSRLGKVRGLFKKIPLVGSILGIGIDLALGERLDNAVAGAAGAAVGVPLGVALGKSLGLIIGAVLGGGVLSWATGPIMAALGGGLGGFLGGWIGDWLGKKIYKDITNQNESLMAGVVSNTTNNTSKLAGYKEYDLEYNEPNTIVRLGDELYRVNSLGAIYGEPVSPETAQQTAPAPQGSLNITNAKTSWYDPSLGGMNASGNKTADGLPETSTGEGYKPELFSAAAFPPLIRLLPSNMTMPTQNPNWGGGLGKTIKRPFNVIVTNKSGKQAILRVNDVGPGVKGHSPNHMLDLSIAARDYFGTGEGFSIQMAPSSSNAGPVSPGDVSIPSQVDVTPSGSTTTSDHLKKDDMVSGYPVTSPYGPRWGRTHGGLDIGTPVGTYVAFTENAEILYTGLYGRYGYLIDVWLPNAKVQLRLGHLSEILVNKGDRIPARTPVGRTGGMEGHPGAGSSTGPHLHIEADTVKGRGDYGGSGDPSKYMKYLILSRTGGAQVTPSGDTTSLAQTSEVRSGDQDQQQSAQIQPGISGVTPGQTASSVSSQASYERSGGGNVVVTLPGGGQVQGKVVSGGSQGAPTIMVDPGSILNSYYKAQLLGFLYKQG